MFPLSKPAASEAPVEDPTILASAAGSDKLGKVEPEYEVPVSMDTDNGENLYPIAVLMCASTSIS